MTLLFFFIAGIALGMWVKGKSFENQAGRLTGIRDEAKEALAERTRKRKEKILEFMKSEALHQKDLEVCDVPGSPTLQESVIRNRVTREDIEKLLSVTDGTARKYLNELESEGRIKQIGSTGRDVHYELL